jgi:hypothetical protein
LLPQAKAKPRKTQKLIIANFIPAPYRRQS